MARRSPRLARTLPAQILTAPAAQSLVVPGTAAFARVISGVAGQLRDVPDERAELAAELEARLEAHPLGPVLTSMPGLGVRTAIKLLTIVGDGSAFPTAAHLAAYAGLAPRHPSLRGLDQGREPLPTRQPRPEIGAVPLRVRRPRRPRQPRLLRPQKSRRQTPQRRPDLPAPPPHRHLRHAPRLPALPSNPTRPGTPRGLTTP